MIRKVRVVSGVIIATAPFRLSYSGKISESEKYQMTFLVRSFGIYFCMILFNKDFIHILFLYKGNRREYQTIWYSLLLVTPWKEVISMRDNFVSKVFATNAAFRNVVNRASGSTHAVRTVPCTISDQSKSQSTVRNSFRPYYGA